MKTKLIICLMLCILFAIPAMVAAADWPQVNYDVTYSRNSPQTVIGKSNVANLEVAWIYNTNYPVEDPPLIIGNTAYIQNNAVQVFAVDLTTGLNKWKYDPKVVYTGSSLPRASSSHGMTTNNGILYAPTGPKGTIVALDMVTGNLIWESPVIFNAPAYRQAAPPVFWNNIIVAGSALGDEPPFGVAVKGTVSGLDMSTGKLLWQTQLCVGDWVTTSPNASQNGGCTVWTGGAIDTDTGVVFLPVGNPSPDFKPDIRSPPPNKYANHVIAVNITDGKILWATPFIAQGTVLPQVTALPDAHDWDCSWGTNLVTVDMGNGPQKVVIGHDKRGDVMAMDAATGIPLWNVQTVALRNVDQNPTPTGTDIVMPGPAEGVESFTATDGKYVYAAVSNQAGRYYSEQPSFLSGTGLLSEGGMVPDFNVMPSGYANGSVLAIDLKTGTIAWETKFEYGTFVSPLVTNGIVFSGHLTDIGKPFNYSDFGGPTSGLLQPGGILLALDASNGNILWQTDVGAQVGIGGPSIGNGYLLVPTGGIQTYNNGGYVVAFRLPGALPTITPTTPPVTTVTTPPTTTVVTTTTVPPTTTTVPPTTTTPLSLTVVFLGIIGAALILFLKKR
jgi:alcohol dehydrogenase (cytochrome c)